jgi:hypothetical protein
MQLILHEKDKFKKTTELFEFINNFLEKIPVKVEQ